jgi:hypothetical protein
MFHFSNKIFLINLIVFLNYKNYEIVIYYLIEFISKHNKIKIMKNLKSIIYYLLKIEYLGT